CAVGPSGTWNHWSFDIW
nr:immunoglobulin heavy chain junction region [Macaca mulatta]MOX58816.1 immunoglobulin heavy chain junction region [Macaca mulatta]MOX59056.1 immunoglobulin heavy chain junction region [Macaca mulatta]MOX59126.1 immunoglobulin heavy chain junction region [Macaca mulatta]MOX59214.1 immunoglobulin heavy chain junction region [Macaca mulatta]